ncbi:MAG: ShlB/FhaC/HecB family hemolysin secretion/activation protein [Gemmatimonadaceae bacterium]
MYAFLAALVLAQTSVTVQIGGPAKAASADSVKRIAHEDSVRIQRETRRDSMRVVRKVKDSARIERRRATRIAVTPALIASAFRDSRAATLLTAARTSRLEQDSTLRGYDATSYERLSVKMGFKRIGRDRLLVRSERVGRVTWQRGSPAVVQLLGKRHVMPMLEGAADAEFDDEFDVPIPYYPGRETLWVGSGIAKADVNESEMIHPLARGAEAYYTYATGDSVSFMLPGSRRIELRELVVRPRAPSWNVALGSLWFDVSSARLVRAVYRLAEPLDIWKIANEEEENKDDRPPKWVTAAITPLTAQVSAITVEYGLHEGRFWMPRLQAVEGSAQAGFMRVPFKIEQSFKYASVNGTSMGAPPQFAVGDTAQDSVSRSHRATARRNECKAGGERTRTTTRYEGHMPVMVRIPCDTVALAHSPELPKSIYDDGEELFGVKERDALIDDALTLGAQPGFIPQKPVITYGLGLTRYNRIEGLSTGIAARQSLGAGYTARAMARIGIADLSPNAELGLTRTDGRRTVGIGAYRRLSSANDWADPFSFGSSLSALLFGRDEGFYYRTLGLELTGTADDSATGSWRIFAERHVDAKKKTDFSLAHSISGTDFRDNIDAGNGNIVGLAVERHGSHGLDPHGLRLFGSVRAETAAGDFDYSRAMFDATVSHGLGPRLSGAFTLSAGTSGGTVPLQRLWYLGGTQTVRGQRPGASIGDAFWMTRLELGTAFVGARPVVFGDLGWAGSREDFDSPGRPISGAGVGASFLDGLVRFDVARGIYPEKKVRANLYVEARF